MIGLGHGTPRCFLLSDMNIILERTRVSIGTLGRLYRISGEGTHEAPSRLPFFQYVSLTCYKKTTAKPKHQRSHLGDIGRGLTI